MWILRSVEFQSVTEANFGFEHDIADHQQRLMLSEGKGLRDRDL